LGADIIMLVYPTGEIANITENKNLWEAYRDFLGLSADGLWQVVFPEGNSAGKKSWDRFLEITRLGAFQLKQGLTLKAVYHTENTFAPDKITFSGRLNLPDFQTGAELAELEDNLELTMRDCLVYMDGSAAYSLQQGAITGMEYSWGLKGLIDLQGSGREKYETEMLLDLEGKVRYQLIRQ